MRTKEDKDFVKPLNIFKKILDQLKKVDVKINEEDRILLLFISLVDSYNNFIEMILSGNDTKQVKEALVSWKKHKYENINDETLVIHGWG